MQTTLWGNLILGPTARDMHLPEVAAETTEDILTYILGKCKQLVPSFDASEVIHTFSGSRAKNSTGDWIIGVSAASKQFINAAGIDSPGLAGSPAIALEIVRLLQSAGLTLTKDPTFNPIRAPIIVPKDGWKGIKAGPVGKVTDPKQNIVCKCEKVTEAEVVTALHRSLPIDSTQVLQYCLFVFVAVCEFIFFLACRSSRCLHPLISEMHFNSHLPIFPRLFASAPAPAWATARARRRTTTASAAWLTSSPERLVCLLRLWVDAPGPLPAPSLSDGSPRTTRQTSQRLPRKPRSCSNKYSSSKSRMRGKGLFWVYYGRNSFQLFENVWTFLES